MPLPHIEQDRKGYTCLALAAIGGHSDVVKILADKDSSLLNIRDREGKSPIDLCAEHGKTAGHWAAAAVLLAMDPELLDAKPEAPRAPSPKQGAAGTKPKSKFGAAAMMLGGAKASASKAPTGLAMSTMHYAALHGQAAGVRLVLGLQTNAVENRDGDGNSPLHLACKGGHVEVLRLLLDINKGPGAPNTAGDTLLHAAAAAGQLECVTLVMRECPTLTTATNSKGHSSLMSATLAVDTAGKGEALKRAGKSAVAVSKALLDASPALLSMSDSKGQTCLHLAAKSGRCEDLVFLFAERGHAALIRTQDHDGAPSCARALSACFLSPPVRRSTRKSKPLDPVRPPRALPRRACNSIQRVFSALLMHVLGMYRRGRQRLPGAGAAQRGRHSQQPARA